MIGVIGAMDDEVSLLCKSMEGLSTQKIKMFEFYSGKIEGKDVTVLRCDVGKVNAAVGCALLIREFKAGRVINTGSAGGINPQLKVGDAIISTGLVYHDVDVTAFGYAPGQVPRQPPVFPVDEKLVSAAKESINELKKENLLPADFNYCPGLIGSGDSFMHEPDRIANVRKIFPEIAAVEMEGAAIAHCCNLFEIPVLVIRALSDVAGTQSPVSFKEFLPVASRHSAYIVMRIIKKI
jgi:adenosylhomocysteine nucleosidase